MNNLTVARNWIVPYKKQQTLKITQNHFIKRPSIVKNKIAKLNKLSIKRKSFSSDVHLYGMTYLDIFTMSAIRNLLFFQLPCVLMYRTMKFSVHHISYFLLFNGMFKTFLDILTMPK
jgi:hypothetical protein